MGVAERIKAGQIALEQLQKERAWSWIGAILSLVPLWLTLAYSVAVFSYAPFLGVVMSALMVFGASCGTASLFFFAIDKVRDPNKIGKWYKGLWVGNATVTVIVFLASPLFVLAIGPVMAGAAVVLRVGAGRMAMFLLAPLVSLGISYAIRVFLPELQISLFIR